MFYSPTDAAPQFLYKLEIFLIFPCVRNNENEHFASLQASISADPLQLPGCQRKPAFILVEESIKMLHEKSTFLFFN